MPPIGGNDEILRFVRDIEVSALEDVAGLIVTGTGERFTNGGADVPIKEDQAHAALAIDLADDEGGALVEFELEIVTT